MTATYNVAQSPMGIPDFGTDPSNIFSYKLTSLPAGCTLVGTTTANIVFSSAGVLLATTNGGIQLPALSAAQKTSLAAEGRATVWVDASFFATAGQNEFLVVFEGSVNRFAVRKASGQLYFEIQNNAAQAQQAIFSNVGKSGNVRVDFSWNAKYQEIWIDYFLVMRRAWTGDTATTFDGTNNIGGSVARGSGPQTATIYQYELSTKSITNLPVHPLLVDTICIGHSFTTNGAYTQSNLASFMYGSGSNDESSLLCTIHREINKKGFTFGSGRSSVYSTFNGSNGSAVLTSSSTNTNHLKVGMAVYGTQAQAGATIQSIDSGTQITLSSTLNAAASGAPFLFVDTSAQATMSPEFDRIHLFGSGGSTIAGTGTLANNASLQIDYAAAMHHRAPTACVLITGINDVIALNQTPMTSQFLTDFQTVINKLLAANPKMKIVVVNMTNPAGIVGNSFTAANVDQGNAYIASLPSLYPTSSIAIVDAFNLFGGWAAKDAEDFSGDNLHLTVHGFWELGVAVARALYTLL